MALDDDIRFLSGVAFFEGFTADQLRLIAFGAERLRLPVGETLFREGEAADCAYLVVEGALVLFTSEGAKRRAAGRARAGAMLGELALIAGTLRPATAEAAADSRLLRLGRKDFRRVLEEYPDLAARLHQRTAEQFQTMVRRIERLAPRFS